MLTEELLKHGMDANTPVALVEKGTMQSQQVFITSLQQLPARCESTEIKPPAMIIIGEVVKLHEKLKWFS